MMHSSNRQRAISKHGLALRTRRCKSSVERKRNAGWRILRDLEAAWLENHKGVDRRSAMSKDFKDIANDVVTGVALLQKGAPDTVRAFGALSIAATASKSIDTKTKELMALAIGIAVHCDGCVAFHTKMAHQHGATRDEVAETVALAVYMGGGPAAVYGGDALRAYDQFAGPMP
jgi:AhpD family alkylhydroperoxidase